MKCGSCGKSGLKAGKSFDMHTWWHKERSRRAKNPSSPPPLPGRIEKSVPVVESAHEITYSALLGRRDGLREELDLVNNALVAVSFLMNEGKENK